MTLAYTMPITEYMDHQLLFRVKGLDLSTSTIKSQFRRNTTDALDDTLVLELSTANGKAIISADPEPLSTDFFITLLISSADSLLLTSDCTWDLFVIAASGAKRKLLRGDICYEKSDTRF